MAVAAATAGRRWQQCPLALALRAWRRLRAAAVRGGVGADMSFRLNS